jgi:hypothetical protein
MSQEHLLKVSVHSLFDWVERQTIGYKLDTAKIQSTMFAIINEVWQRVTPVVCRAIISHEIEPILGISSSVISRA